MTEPQRRADWLELFFDLVFVVTVSVLAHDLHGPGQRFGLVAGIAGFYVMDALISWRLGTPWRTTPRWAAPAILLPLVVVLPLSMVLPAWGATIAAALSVLAMFTYSALTSQELRRVAHI